MYKLNVIKFVITLILTGLVYGCGYFKSNLPKSESFNLEEYAGIWRSIGYGYVLKIDQSGMEMFDVVNDHCLKKPFPSHVIASHLNHFVRIDDNTINISATHNSSAIRFIRADFQQTNKILQGCMSDIDTSPLTNFDYFAETMAEHYAFFGIYKQNWQDVVNNYRNLVSATTKDDELFRIFSKMLSGLKDAHVFLKGEVGDSSQRFRPSFSRRLRPALDTAFSHQAKFSEAKAFRMNWYQNYKNNIQFNLLNGKAENINDRIIWGELEQYGYINFLRMTGFSESGLIQDEVTQVRKHMTKIMAKLKNKQAIIIDVTANGGGEDLVGLEIARFFNDSAKPVLSKIANGHKNTIQHFELQTVDSPYLKPVYVITSDHTVSAAETFTLAMRALPNVTHAGDITRGAFSDVLDKTLPNGWELGLSNEVYFDHKGKNWEGVGIEPSTYFPIFAGEDINDSHSAALLKFVSNI